MANSPFREHSSSVQRRITFKDLFYKNKRLALNTPSSTTVLTESQRTSTLQPGDIWERGGGGRRAAEGGCIAVRPKISAEEWQKTNNHPRYPDEGKHLFFASPINHEWCRLKGPLSERVQSPYPKKDFFKTLFYERHFHEPFLCKWVLTKILKAISSEKVCSKLRSFYFKDFVWKNRVL